jgi:hypothetical protein
MILGCQSFGRFIGAMERVRFIRLMNDNSTKQALWEISFVRFQLFLTQREYTAEFLRVKSLHRTSWLDSIPAGSENLLYHIYDRIQAFLPSSSHLNGTDSSSQNSLQGKLTGNIHNLKGQTVVSYRFSFQTVVVYDVKPLFIIIHRQHPLFWTSTSQFWRVNHIFPHILARCPRLQ